MRGYGLPRHIELKAPYCSDAGSLGLKSSAVKYPAKSGDYRNTSRNPDGKAIIRRRQKRAERARVKMDLRRHDTDDE